MYMLNKSSPELHFQQVVTFFQKNCASGKQSRWWGKCKEKEHVIWRKAWWSGPWKQIYSVCFASLLLSPAPPRETFLMHSPEDTKCAQGLLSVDTGLGSLGTVLKISFCLGVCWNRHSTVSFHGALNKENSLLLGNNSSGCSQLGQWKILLFTSVCQGTILVLV